MSIKKKVAKAEQLCLNEFRGYLGSRYDKLLVPNDPLSPIDLLAISGNDEHYFELKHTDKYYLSSFPEAMIDVKKWNSLVTLSSKTPYVFYMRMYKDGFAIWHINSLSDDDWLEGKFERKRVTVSNSSKTKSKCVLLKFDSALYIHRKPELAFNKNAIQRVTIEELQQLLKQ
jgi:hypothetical protein